jgi:hypothetical protein
MLLHKTSQTSSLKVVKTDKDKTGIHVTCKLIYLSNGQMPDTIESISRLR